MRQENEKSEILFALVNQLASPPFFFLDLCENISIGKNKCMEMNLRLRNLLNLLLVLCTVLTSLIFCFILFLIHNIQVTLKRNGIECFIRTYLFDLFCSALIFSVVLGDLSLVFYFWFNLILFINMKRFFLCLAICLIIISNQMIQAEVMAHFILIDPYV